MARKKTPTEIATGAAMDAVDEQELDGMISAMKVIRSRRFPKAKKVQQQEAESGKTEAETA